MLVLRIAYGLPGQYPNRLPSVPKGYWPDFRDAATCGVLLEQVREAWKESQLHCLYYCDGKWCVTFGKGFISWAETEAEALVAALEAKP